VLERGKKSEANRLGGRVKRYAQVGTSMGGVAARLAGAKLFGTARDHAKEAEQLRLALGGLKGPLMKVAQILSTIPAPMISPTRGTSTSIARTVRPSSFTRM